jgi:flavodoxin
MKTLIVHYSRSGNTRHIASEIASRLGAETERLFEVSDVRHGPFGWVRSSIDAVLGNTPALRTLEHDPSEYDLVVIGTPVWWASVSPPIRSFLLMRVLPQKVAFFCTCGGRGSERTFEQMARIAARDPIATLMVRERELSTGAYSSRLADFASKLSPPPQVTRSNGPSRISRA